MTTVTTPETAAKTIDDIRHDATTRLLSIIRRAQHGETPNTHDLAWASDLITDSKANRDMTILAGMHPTTTDRDLTYIGTHVDDTAKTIVYRLMPQAPEHTAELDRVRRLAEIMARTTEGRRESAGPLAVAAYLAWAAGDEPAAARHALAALDINDNETLPTLILVMIDRGITIDQLKR